jgi:hypothetical protein
MYEAEEHGVRLEIRVRLSLLLAEKGSEHPAIK